MLYEKDIPLRINPIIHDDHKGYSVVLSNLIWDSHQKIDAFESTQPAFLAEPKTPAMLCPTHRKPENRPTSYHLILPFSSQIRFLESPEELDKLQQV